MADWSYRWANRLFYTGGNGEFELTVRKRKAYVVVAEGWRIVSGARLRREESVTILVEHVH